RAIGLLRPEYRTAIVLCHVEARPYEEIAQIMDVPLGTVKTFIHRARKEVMRELERLRSRNPGGGPDVWMPEPGEPRHESPEPAPRRGTARGLRGRRARWRRPRRDRVARAQLCRLPGCRRGVACAVRRPRGASAARALRRLRRPGHGAGNGGEPL